MLQADAALERVGAVLFDEYHERSLQADLGLALVLELQQVLRDDLRVLVMSATLDGARVAGLLGRAGDGTPAPVVTSAGRAYPVEVQWRAQRPPTNGTSGAWGAVEAATAATVRRALDAHDGDVLVFLPGAAEIRRVGDALANPRPDTNVRVHALHGLLAPAEQDAAIAPSPPGERKIVLATAIAETSLTIEGVRVVVDAGLARVPRFTARTGMTHLDTVRVSQAGAEQRRGRAGRVAPGVCYRLWSEAEHAGLLAYATPEILEADLAPLALELAAAGVRDPGTLLWLDAPPATAYARARDLLAQLDALTDAGPDGRITAHGRRMAELGLHPRLAHMVLSAPVLAEPGGRDVDARGASWTACAVAALLGERDVLRGSFAQPADVDIELRLGLVRPGPVPATMHGATVDRATVHRVRDDHGALLRRVEVRTDGANRTLTGEAVGALVAAAYPDRIAQRRPGTPGRFLLRNGRGVSVPIDDPLARVPYLAVAELMGTASERESRVVLAGPLSLDAIEAQFASQIVREDEVVWDEAAEVVRARRVDRLGALVLRERASREPDPARAAEVLATVVRARVGADGAGFDALGPKSVAGSLRSRVAFARQLADAGGEPTAVRAGPWPDWSDAALARDIDGWLTPHLVGLRGWAEVRALDFGAILGASLTHVQRAALDTLAPTHLVVPTGSRLPVDYTDPDAPTLAVRLQELFGLAETPRVGGGRVPIVLELLSPAHRPVQVTRDLAGFWRSSYFEVRRELRGRYPRHSWPEDPLSAEATRRAKPRRAGG